ncbi:hypothetical protein VTO73DRAFT_636 [Trametes versicolor]
MARGNRDPTPSESDTEDSQTRFVPRDDDPEKMWDAIEILEERGDKYKVLWDGFDSDGEPYAPTWEYKRDCNPALKRTWKLKQEAKKNRKKSTAKGRQSKVRNATVSAKSKTRSESTSTATTTRQTRRNAKDATPSTSVRPPPRALSPRADSRAPPPVPGPSKQRKSARDSREEDANGASAEPARPRKRRKVEVEIVKSSPARPSPPPESSHEVVARKKFGKVVVSAADAEENADTPLAVRNGSVRPAGSSKGKGGATDNVEGGDEPTSVAVPISKVGPPRHLKRSRQSKSHESVPSRTHSGGAAGSESPTIKGRPRQEPLDQHQSGRSSSRSTKVTPSGSSSNSRARKAADASNAVNGRATNPKEVASSRRSKSSTLAQLEEESESDDEELMNPAFLKVLQKAKSRSVSAQISPDTKRILAQEEEESTQEAANWIPPPPLPAVRPVKPPQAERRSGRSSSHPRQENAEAGPSKPSGRPALQGRPSANDTFSREGIVPETQPYPDPGSADHRRQPSPSGDAFVVDQNPPSTPPRAHSERQPSNSQVTSSVKAKMKRKRTTTKQLRPVPTMSPSVFRPHLPSADDEEIEQFSSPEKDTRRKKRALDIPTQDTIEEAEFTQPMDLFMDWDGGEQPADDPFASEEDGPELSLGPGLPPPDEEGGSRLAMTTVLAKHPGSQQGRSTEAAESPEIPVLQDLPATSTTQRAEADSQSQLSLNGQIAELNAKLEEKDEQLTQLELQLEELQSHIAKLKAEQTEETATRQAELKALVEASDDKTEQISQLESQLVELQLQLTQQASDADNERERHELEVQELRESLEERNEQVSQLESSLVELQEELATAVADSERLAAAAQETATDADHKHAEQILAAQQQVTTLKQELTDVRARLLKAEEESTVLTSRLATTTQEWERRFKYAEDDRDMFKNLYSEASGHATRLAAENAALEARATLAEGQVRDGLAMIRGTFEGQAQTLRAEAEKWRALCSVLTAKDERTDDDVRRRAAVEPRLREENARLKEDAEIVRADMEKMAGIIAQMTEQRERSEEDAHADADVEMDEDGEADAEDSSPWHGKAFRVLNGCRSFSPRVSPRASLESGEIEEVLYACRHVQDGRMCNEPFTTPEDVAEHARKAHYPDVYTAA